MQFSNLPAKITTPFANSGSKRTIPVASQIGITAGAASYTDGFPPLTFTPLASGGVPPAGQDFNGVLNAITLIQQWQSAGGNFVYDAAWSTANGGYPKGAVLLQANQQGFWLCTVDNNTSNPDTGSPTGWAPMDAVGIAAVTGLAASNVTLTPAQYGLPIITLAGTLTANVQIIFPAIVGPQWLIVNNTTGAFAVTAKTSAGTGQVVPQGGALAVWGDGTNLNTAAAPGRLINVQRLTSSGTYTKTPGANSGLIRMIGGGAGGSASAVTGASTVSVGMGGAAGSYLEHYFTTLPATQAFTIGAAGAGGSSGSAGGAGGATTFGALSAPGGAATSAPSAFAPPYMLPGGSAGASASGGNLVGAPGQPGGSAIALAATSFISGAGGPSVFGGGGAGLATSSGNGIGSGSNGGGGGGAAGGGSQASFPGGGGGAGLILVYEYA